LLITVLPFRRLLYFLHCILYIVVPSFPCLYVSKPPCIICRSLLSKDLKDKSVLPKYSHNCLAIFSYV